MSFSDELTAGQVQKVQDELGLPWRVYFNPENDGWVNMDCEYFWSDLSINIYHGGWVDQYHANTPKRENFPGSNKWFPRDDPGFPTSGDLVMLVMFLKFGPGEEAKAIAWIKDVLGIRKGVQAPELGPDGRFYRQWSGEGNQFVQVPDPIWRSNLSSSAKLVWMAIASRVNKDQVYSYAGIRDICKQTTLASRTVQNALVELETAGVLHQKPARTGRRIFRFPIVRPIKEINFFLNQKISLNGEQKTSTKNK